MDAHADLRLVRRQLVDSLASLNLIEQRIADDGDDRAAETLYKARVELRRSLRRISGVVEQHEASGPKVYRRQS